MPKLQREYEGTARVKGVPHRYYNVILVRSNPTDLQHANIIVASFNDRDSADLDAQKRSDSRLPDDGNEFFVEEN